jgi:hypothetical protein
MAAVREAAAHYSRRGVITRTASIAHDDVLGTMSSHMDSQTATKTLQTTHNQIRNVGPQLQSSKGRSNRHLDIAAVVGNHNLANMLSTSDVGQSSRYIVESILDNRVDSIYMTSFNKLEDFSEKSFNHGRADVLGIGKINSAE